MAKIKKRTLGNLQQTKKCMPSVSIKRAEEIINKAAAEKSISEGIGFDAALKTLSETFANASVTMPSFIKPKFESIANRVIDDIPEETKKELIEQDAQIKGFYIELDKAIKNNKVLTQAIVNRQIVARQQEVILAYAEKRISTLVLNGNILDYFDDEDRKNYQLIRDQFTIVMDIVDSTLQDFQQTLKKIGIDSNVQMLLDVEKARKAIEGWYENGMKSYDRDDRDAIEDESGKIYDYIRKDRIPVLCRKLDKLKTKKIKTNE